MLGFGSEQAANKGDVLNREEQMNQIGVKVTGAILTMAFVSASAAESRAQWETISDPGEVRKLISDKVVDGKYWIYFFRRDGNMAYYYVSSKAMTIRKWSVRKDGQVCSSVFVKPDRVIACSVFQRTSGATPKYRVRTSGMGTSAFTLIPKPAPFLVKAVEAKAGPVK